MPTILNIRFQKMSQYDEPIFITNGNMPNEETEFTQLLSYAAQLKPKVDDNSFLPIYHNEKFNYASIRFKSLKADTIILTQNARYTITFATKMSQNTNTKMNQIKCHINSIVQTAEAPVDSEEVELV